MTIKLCKVYGIKAYYVRMHLFVESQRKLGEIKYLTLEELC